jgi:N-acetylglucosamine-6-sulfatase
MRSPRRLPSMESLESRRLLSATAAEPAVARPNFVFIMSDDQDSESIQFMPRLQALLAAQGTTFENAFVTNPVCGPSNVSILTGQYSHNNQILTNQPPQGGFQKFVNMGTDGNPVTLGDENTLATWLQDADYLTGRVGKYLVGYPVGSTYIPPGWDQWISSYDGFSSFYNYRLNENGTVVQYGGNEADYLTDVMNQKAAAFIEGAEATDDQPFFLYYSANAPHGGTSPNGAPTPAPRHLGTFAGAQAPRSPSFNEADMSDKPPHLRNLPLLTDDQIAALDREYQARLESLQSLDEGIGRIIDSLAASGELDNTYIVFTSDNGYHLGEHRQFLPFGPFPRSGGKGEAYEEDIRVPLVIRGPGVPAGVTLEHMAANIDFAPTITELANAPAGREMDGRSLVPLFAGDVSLNEWRHDFLVEIYRTPMQSGSPGFALRTRFETYVEYADGFRELYDLRTDPYQTQNIYATADPAHIQALSDRLHDLIVSRGDSSRANPPAARVASVVVNNGSAQRSMVESLTVTFDQQVTIDSGAFTLQRQDGTTVAVNVATSTANGQTVAVLTFTGPGITRGSLADGNYVLTIRGDRVRNLLGQELDGDTDGTAGGDRADGFSRLFGDSDGDGDVDGQDRDLFRSAFESESGYLWYFDFDADGDVDGLDNGQFNRRFGRQ